MAKPPDGKQRQPLADLLLVGTCQKVPVQRCRIRGAAFCQKLQPDSLACFHIASHETPKSGEILMSVCLQKDAIQCCDAIRLIVLIVLADAKTIIQDLGSQ